MNFLELLSSGAGQTAAQKMQNKFGINSSQIMALMAVAAPLIIAQLQKKSQDPVEAERIANAIDKDHDGSVLDDPDQIENRQDEGNSILSHIFGGQKTQVESQLSERSGIAPSQVGGILAMLAPLVMGYIGRQKNNKGVGSDGLGGLLGGLLSGGQGASQGGGMLNDLLGGLQGGSQQGGLGDILGGLLGGGNQNQSQQQGSFGIDDLLGKFLK